MALDNLIHQNPADIYKVNRKCYYSGLPLISSQLVLNFYCSSRMMQKNECNPVQAEQKLLTYCATYLQSNIHLIARSSLYGAISANYVTVHTGSNAVILHELTREMLTLK